MSNIIEESRVFTKFPELPVELQLQICAASLSDEPRLVALWLKTWQIEGGTPKEAPGGLHKFLCKNPPPTLLHVNRQFREIALKVFSLQIKTPIQKCPIYINPDLDTIYSCNFIASADERFQSIRHLAVPFSNDRIVPPGCSDGYWGQASDLYARLRTMPLLEDVVFVSHHGRCLLHIANQLTIINFSHLTKSTSPSFAAMWNVGVSLEKALHPGWKVPKFYEKNLEMPDGKLNCLQGRRGALS